MDFYIATSRKIYLHIEKEKAPWIWSFKRESKVENKSTEHKTKSNQSLNQRLIREGLTWHNPLPLPGQCSTDCCKCAIKYVAALQFPDPPINQAQERGRISCTSVYQILSLPMSPILWCKSMWTWANYLTSINSLHASKTSLGKGTNVPFPRGDLHNCPHHMMQQSLFGKGGSFHCYYCNLQILLAKVPFKEKKAQ